jgi:hypothetical protein
LETDWNSSQWERDWWENMYANVSENEFVFYPQCIDDPDKTLSLYGPGSIDDLDRNKNVSKFFVNMKRCDNSSLRAGISHCSTPEQIDDWLEGKLFDIAYINSRLALEPPYKFSMKQYIQVLDMFPMSPG